MNTLSQIEISAALGRVIGAVEKRSTMPCLDHVLIEARGDRLAIAATDLNIHARTSCPATIEAAWSCCVPAEKFKSALAGLQGEIGLHYASGSIIVDGETCHFELAALPAEDFPANPDDDTEGICDLGDLMQRSVRAIGHAASQDQNKSNLGGIYLCHENGRLTAVATDGHRLSLAGVDCPDSIPLKNGIILSSKASRILSGVDSLMTLRLDKSRTRALFQTRSLGNYTARLIAGKYPDYRRIIPTKYIGSLVVNIQALRSALESCGVLADDKSRSIQIDAQNERLTVSALGPLGTATATLPCAGESQMQIRINSRYLLLALKGLEGDEVFLRFDDEKSPLMLIPVDHGQWDERLELIMPLK